MPLPIQSLLRDEAIQGPLLLTELQGRKTRNGADYLDLKLKDATGSVAAKMWQTSVENLSHIDVPSTVWVKARVDEYQGRPQLVVEQVDPYTPTDDEYRQLIPTSAWPSELLWDEIRLHLRAEITDDELWTLIDAVLEHPDVRHTAPTIPAAARNHHAYRSGLAEHILSMLRLSAKVVQHYENYYPYRLHRGLVAAGVLLHDIGKVWELSGDMDAKYTDEGRLLGHIFMAARWLEDVAKPLGTSRGLIVELQHMILSHHGLLEFGSPKRPKTLEAMLLHHIDKLDADMNQWMAELVEPGWTPYQRNYERPLFRPDHLREAWTDNVAAAENPRGPGVPLQTFHARHAKGSSPEKQMIAEPTPNSPVSDTSMQTEHRDALPSAPEMDTLRAKKTAITEQAPPKPSPNLGLFDGLGDD